MYEVEKQKLKHLLSRKAKSDSISFEEKMRWKSEIDKIDMEIVSLMKLIGQDNDFTEEKALELLHQANRHIIQTCNFNNTDAFKRVWTQYPGISKQIDHMQNKINKAFKKQSIWLLNSALRGYIESWTRASDMATNPSKALEQIGFNKIDNLPDGNVWG